MKKYISALTLLLAGALLFTSCNLTGINSPSEENGNDTQQDESYNQEEHQNASHYDAAYITALVEAEANEPVLGLFADDFDFDGVYEAYVLTSPTPIPEGQDFGGTMSLWFVKNDKVNLLLEKSALSLSPEIWNFSDKKLFCIDENSSGSPTSVVFFAAGSSAYSYGNFGARLVRASDDSNDFYLLMGTDALESKMPYYLWFDGNFFCEYAGLEIRADQLRALPGADEILTAISDGGYTIGNIFYRSNGIININVSKDTATDNVTLMLSDGNVHLVPHGEAANPLMNLENTEAAKKIISEDFANSAAFSYGGAYVASILPHIAEYPENIGE